MTVSRYRNALPQLTGSRFLTDGGLETTLIFHNGLELPDFAAFHLLRTSEGREALLRYFRSYAEIARRFETGLILESATWRASADWGGRLGCTPAELAEANRASVELLEEIRDEYESGPTVSSSAGAWARAEMAALPAQSCLHSRPRTTIGKRSRRSPERLPT
jgi:S-methylmethionine-dependent homocysteine/selenocysteine methylase